MGVATTYQISVGLRFPDGDVTKQPSVTNAVGQNDDIESTATSIEWTLTNDQNLGADPDNVRITGVSFYWDREKRMPANPAFLDAGANNGNLNWVVPINSNAVAESTTVYYDLKFADDNFPTLDWDPTLTIKPRGT